MHIEFRKGKLTCLVMMVSESHKHMKFSKPYSEVFPDKSENLNGRLINMASQRKILEMGGKTFVPF